MVEQVIRCEYRANWRLLVGGFLSFGSFGSIWALCSGRSHCGTRSWAQKAGWLKMGAEWPEDMAVGRLGR